MAEGRLIEFTCENPRHRDQETPSVGTITVHEGRCAYCGSEFVIEHAWKQIEAIPVERLFRVKPSSAAAKPKGTTPPPEPVTPKRAARPAKPA